MTARLRTVGWLLIVTGAVCSATVFFLAAGVLALAAGVACLLISTVTGAPQLAAAPAAALVPPGGAIEVPAATVAARAPVAVPEGMYVDTQGRARCRAGLLVALRGNGRGDRDAKLLCPLLDYPELDCAQPCFHRSA